MMFTRKNKPREEKKTQNLIFDQVLIPGKRAQKKMTLYLNKIIKITNCIIYNKIKLHF